MKMLGRTFSPAVIIILVMVLINAGVILYFVDQGQKRDKQQQDQISLIQKLTRQNRLLIENQENERLIRTDQNCESLERTHLREVEDLRGTYEYLKNAEQNPAEKQTVLYKIIYPNVPKTIAAGETDLAPEYCDDPGYGLKEPDPVIPERPDFLPAAIFDRADKIKNSGPPLDNRPIDPDITMEEVPQDLRNK